MQDYPNCNVQYPGWIGDGRCRNYGAYNTAACGFDGGDCEEFNAKYPNCSAFVGSYIGNGRCQNYDNYNTVECGFDGGDCEEFNFNTKYPFCIVSSPQLIGDGNCDGGDNTSMEAIVKNSMRSIPTALPLLHHGLEIAVVKIMITTIQSSVASMEAIVKNSISIRSIPFALFLLHN